MSMQIKFWGVWGSLPTSPMPEQLANHAESILNQFFQSGLTMPSQINEFIASNDITKFGGFGTATTCAEIISTQGQQLIIDGGSGIRNLSEKMVRQGPQKNKSSIHIFLTHFHWDHLIGLPFFAPLFIAGNEIHFYAVQPELESIIRSIFKKPYFPVPYETLPSQIKFHTLSPRVSIQINDLKITPYQLDHPDPCWGYKIESNGKTYSHCVDTEGTRSTRETLGLDLPLYQNVDVMYFDAQYSLPDLGEKANWGHSAAQIGLEIAFREGIKQIIFAHHDPGASTHRIEETKKQTEDYYRWKMRQAEKNNQKLPEVKWAFAYEGMEIKL